MDHPAKNMCANCMRETKEGEKCPHCGFDPTSYAAAPHHLPVGTLLIERYLIGRALGEGAFGVTYAGKDMKRGMAVAIKEYYPDGFVTRDTAGGGGVLALSDTAAACFARGRGLFLRQADILSRLPGQPGIGKVRAFFEANDTAYAVMDRIEGMDMDAFADRIGGKIRPNQMFTLMRPVLEALAGAHAAGLNHLDICPENIMVDPKGAAALVDFGSARVSLTPVDEKTLAAMLRTGYAAEEQYRPDAAPDARTDVYAVCATMYKLMTGIRPPDARERRHQDTLVLPSALGLRIDSRVEAALLQGMAVRAEDRPDGVAALCALFYGQTPAQPENLPADPPPAQPPQPSDERPRRAAPPPPAPQRPLRKRKRRGWVAALLALALIAAAAFGVWFFVQRQTLAFEDPAFERMVRAAFSAEGGVVTASSLRDITGITIDGDTLSLTYRTPRAPDTAAGNYGTVASLADLHHFPSLTKLSVKDQRVTDLAPVAALSGLTDLSLINCGLTDVSALSGLTKIASLYLYNNTIADISAAASMPGLVRLYLDGNEVQDLTPLAKTTKLAELSARDNRVADLSPLRGLDALSLVSLAGNPVADWSPVASVAEVVGRPEGSMPIEFADKAFEEMLRAALNKPNGLILASDLSSVARIAISGGTLTFEVRTADNYTPGASGSVTSLEDLRHFPALKALYVADNAIVDLSPLADLPGLTSLSVAGCGVRDILPLAGLTKLHTLALPQNRVQDISALAGLSLTRLILDHNAISDISALARMNTLQELSIQRNNVQDLSPLDGLKGLTVFRAAGNPVADWTPVAAVATVEGREPTPPPFTPVTFADKKFEELLRAALGKPTGQIAPDELAGIDALTIIGDTLTLGMLPEPYKAGKAGHIASLQDLQHFPGLTQLHIADLALADVGPVANLTNLTNLLIANCGVKDVSPLAALTGLDTLYLYDNQIRDLSPLAGLRLETLGLSQNAVEDVTPLQGMGSLRELYLAGNKVSDILPLAGLPALTALQLTGNPVADWLPLAHLQAVAGRPDAYNAIVFADAAFERMLREALGRPDGFLYPAALTGYDAMTLRGDTLAFSFTAGESYAPAASGGVATLDDLRHFPGLTALRVQDNPVSDLSPVSRRTGITSLYLAGTEIDSLAPLSGLVGLTSVDLYNNPRLTSLSGLPAKNLTHLTAVGNALADITALADAKGLTALMLDRNAIADIVPLAKLDKLADLSIAGNNVSDLSPLEKLMSLTSLDLTDNPVTDWNPVARLPVVGGRPASKDPLAFADAGFEGLLRKTLNRASGAIIAADLADIDALTVAGDTMTFTVDGLAPHAAVKQGPVAVWDDLEHFPSLRALVLQDQPAPDLSPLASLSALTDLTVAGCNIQDVTPLGALTNLTSLALPRNAIAALPAMPGASPLPVSLAALDLTDNALTYVTALAPLTNLRALALDRNRIEDIAPLDTLVNLKSLTLSGNNAANIGAVASMPALTTLDLTGNPVADWTPAAHIQTAIGRPAEYNPAVFQDATFERLLREALGRPEGFLSPADLSGIQAMTIAGDTLTLTLATPDTYAPGEMGSITTLADLALFPALTDLYIQDQHVPDLAPLAALTELNYLSLNHCGVADLAPLAELMNLRYLYLYDNAVSDLAPLVNLPLAWLALSRNAIADIRPLGEIKELQQLWLTGNRIDNLSPLANLTNLTHLYITNNAVRDLSPLSGLASLTTLYATGNPIEDWGPVTHVAEVAGRTPENSPVVFEDDVFERLVRAALGKPEGSVTAAELSAVTALTILGDTMSFALDIPAVYEAGAFGTMRSLGDLRHFTNLTSLYVQDQPTQDIASVAQLTKLTYLGVNHCEVESIAPLENLAALESLYLHDNRVSDLSPLSGLPLLRLGLSRNAIEDVSPLAGMENLSRLWLNGNRVQDVSPLANLSALEALYLSDNAIGDVTPLVGLNRLTALALDGNPVTDWSPVVSIPGVTGLSPEDVPIAFTDAVFEALLRAAMERPSGPVTPRDLAAVTELEIDADGISFTLGAQAASEARGKVQSLTDVARFPNLTRLIVRNQPVADLTPLLGLDNLTYLAVTGCDVADLTPLTGLSVERLGLSSNQIDDVTPLGTMPRLTHLYLGGNRISNIAPLAGLKGLIELNLSANQISDIKPLAELPKLSLVYLTDNPVADWSPVVHVPAVYGRPDGYVPIAFADPVFESMLRAALNKPYGDILPADLAPVTALTLAGNTLSLDLAPPPADETLALGPLQSLEDLKHFTNLAQLYVRAEPVGDLTPLAGLTGLTYLTVSGCDVQDITPLAGLPLERLGLPGNQIADLSPLAGMGTLAQLYIGDNGIQDIAPLVGLTNLTHLSVAGNAIEDLSPLAGHTKLEHLYLTGNPVRDYTPVKDVPNVYGP